MLKADMFTKDFNCKNFLERMYSFNALDRESRRVCASVDGGGAVFVFDDFLGVCYVWRYTESKDFYVAVEAVCAENVLADSIRGLQFDDAQRCVGFIRAAERLIDA